MLGDSTTSSSSAVLGSSTAGPLPEAGRRHDDMAEENNSGEEDRGGDRSFGGNRWPRQETLALLKIRSEMDVAFRDATVKGPLWEQVSRKLAELGYHRSAKKCKEKFENVYKYHKRTKEVRSGKQDGKTYKFFEQLEALDSHPTPPPPLLAPKSVPSAMALPPQTTAISHIPTTVPSITSVPHLMNISFSQPNPTIHLQPPPAPPLPNPTNVTPPLFNISTTTAATFQNIEADLISNSTSSSSTSSDEEIEASRRRKKRKWKDFFEKLMREVIQKQEEMQRRFLEAIEKREHERVVREDAWRTQEMAKINREREILAQERSMAAAKDAAITSFLQKITETQPNPSSQPPPTATPTPPAPPPPPMPPMHQSVATVQILPNSAPQKPLNNETQLVQITKTDPNGGEIYSMSPGASSSRWPKAEVEALIKLRTDLEAKYQENGPKGPLWEEISAGMRKFGYNRNARRCKEKWENINKYFKKVKESRKTRREDSKTCPYFNQLDALYKEKKNNNNNNSKFENMIGSSTLTLQQQQPLMVRPEQQWPPQQEMTRPDSGNEEMESEPMDRDDKDGDDDDEDENEEDEEGGGNYEIVASKPAAVSAAE